MSTPFNPTPDLTGRQPAAGPGVDMRQQFVACGHKGSKVGATFRGNLPWRCPACTAERAARATA